MRWMRQRPMWWGLSSRQTPLASPPKHTERPRLAGVGAYGGQLEQWVRDKLEALGKMVPRPPQQKGFQVLPGGGWWSAPWAGLPRIGVFALRVTRRDTFLPPSSRKGCEHRLISFSRVPIILLRPMLVGTECSTHRARRRSTSSWLKSPTANSLSEPPRQQLDSQLVAHILSFPHFSIKL